ncbi:DNA-binding response regulator, NarL/FixJ family, contains REC and HTH domains [Roseovarius litoreus]|uniref:DNA-binding response regulator, NarL/FixJ family, contains REC and HTH domains n=1 Tax=Roseovarius litoreus TaxID=1155722 RepID=A0A1M7KYR9_9RHOB|nr:LuxR C-terminal-related transcriptional regulator [Roseovarius litoreus]SHM70639.1 DNA-binding response regulator, NarL/FixJ family, contains REC and HTH domains [Roseovarius litoreus]
MGTDIMTKKHTMNMEEHSPPNVALVGLKKVMAGALSFYLRSKASANVSVFDTYQQLKSNPCVAMAVDVVLLDGRAHSLQTIEGCKPTIGNGDAPKVAVYFDEVDPGFARAALRRGADGIIDGDFNVDALPRVIELISDGEVFVPASVLGLNSTHRGNHSGAGTELDGVQKSILIMISKGYTNKEIAQRLDTSDMHVKMTVRATCNKLDAKNRAHAVAKAIRLNVI